MDTLCIITALPAEASPLVAHRALRWQRSHGFHYAEAEGIVLFVAGIGKLAASVAVARFCQWRGDVGAILNVGIGGSDRPVGTALLAHTIEDAGSGWRYHPQLPPARHLPTVDTARVLSVDRPCNRYLPDTVFDMEAAGLAAAARAFVGVHGLQCLKVVSDGPDAAIESIDKPLVERLIGDQLPLVDALIDAMTPQRDEHEAAQLQYIDALCEDIVAGIRHTQTQRHQLQRRLQRIVALGGQLPASSDCEAQDARALARRLDQQLLKLGVRY